VQRAADGPLHGEPVTVKDWIDVAGFRCSGGTPAHAERRPAEDATAVARLRAAGAVVVAKTAVHVDGVRHPRDPSLSPGGTSSGDAAAVGGGAVRLGLGSDSGGSVRVPAAWCGVVGLKPSAGLIPTTGHFPRVGDRSDGRTVLGPLAATVDLAWTAVRVMAGPDDADGAVAPVRLGDPDDVDVSTLRVAIGIPRGVEVAPDVRDALEQARELLRTAGAREVGPPPDWVDEALSVTDAYWNRADRQGSQVADDLFAWDRFRRRVLQATRDVDVVVTPTVAGPAPPHRPMRTTDYLLCLPASLTGAPAVSVPFAGSAVQVIARRWEDTVAVAVARLLEVSSA
jgi:Asp-tRNA(Asn)/Glu-tRNA(Gln) amidotransferase A subunit family amidase